MKSKKNICFLFFCYLLFLWVLPIRFVHAQIESVISGKVVDHVTGVPLQDAQVYIKDQLVSTNTDINGSFRISFQLTPPVKLVIEIQGYESKNIDILASQNDLIITLIKKKYQIASYDVQLISQVNEPYLKSTAEIIKIKDKKLKYNPFLTAYEALESLPSVYKTQNSIVSPTFFTRGFATNLMSRTQLMVNGKDISTPIIGFSLGNFAGLPSIDTESIEVLKGSSSSIYGPNRYSGIISLKSKDPFIYSLLSAEVSSGITQSNNRTVTTAPFYKMAVRYAVPISRLLYFKAAIDYSYFTQDWGSIDDTTHREYSNSKINMKNSPTFDGLFLHGDENEYLLSYNNFNGEKDFFLVSRTGIPEKYLNDEGVKNLLSSASIHFKFTNYLTGKVGYRLGYGDSIYQGINKFKIKNSALHNINLELKYNKSYIRLYANQTDTGDSWSYSYLSNLINEKIKPSSKWGEEYLFTYKSAIEGLDPRIPGLIDISSITNENEKNQAIASNNNTILAAHQKARSVADDKNINYDSKEFRQLVDEYKNKNISPIYSESGAKLVDSSRDYHLEIFHRFKDLKSKTQIQMGGKLVIYDLSSNGVLYNEAKINNSYKRIINNNVNGFIYLKQPFYSDLITIDASLNANKNDNFDLILSNRVGLVTSLKSHHLRFIYQTAFRNPDVRNQYFWLQNPTNIYVGNTKANLGDYGLHTDTVYDAETVEKFISTGGSFNSSGVPFGTNIELLNSQNVQLTYLQPEEVHSFEMGYRGMFKESLLINISYNFSQHFNYFYQRSFYNKKPITRNGEQVTFANNSVIGRFTMFQNAKGIVNTQSLTTSIKWQVTSHVQLNSHYTLADSYLEKSVNDDKLLQNQYNIPKHKVHFGFLLEKILKKYSLNVEYNYQSSFNWMSIYASGTVNEFGVANAVFITDLPKYKATIKIGANNILGEDYVTSVGYSNIGRVYFVSLLFDNLIKKR